MYSLSSTPNECSKAPLGMRGNLKTTLHLRKARAIVPADCADHPIAPRATLHSVLPVHNPWRVHLEPLLDCMHTELEIMRARIAQVTIAPSSPMLMMHPTLRSHRTLKNLASPLHLHMAALVDAKRPTVDAILPRNLACALRASAKALLLPTMYEDPFNHGGHLPRMIHKPALLCQEWNSFRALPARYFL
jgi:hypothetical protein